MTDGSYTENVLCAQLPSHVSKISQWTQISTKITASANDPV